MKTVQYFTLFLLAISSVVLAQPGGNLGQLELSVTDKYKAQVGEAVKYSDFPKFEDTTTSKLKVNYKITSQPIEVHYQPEPISHARVAKVPVDQIHKGLIKAGFGLYGTPLLEAYWNSDRSSKNSYGFWGNHFSTHSGVKETVFEDNGLSNNQLGGYYNHFYKDFTWNTQLMGRWDKYSYYGIDDYPASYGDSLDDIKKPEPPENWYRQYEINTSIKQKDAKDLGAAEEVGLRYYNFSDAMGALENYMKLGTQWNLPTGGVDLDLGVNLTYFNTSFDTILAAKQSYFTAQIYPNVTVALGDLLFDFGLNLYSNNYSMSANDSTDYSMRFFPEIKVEYPFVEDVLAIYGGVKGQQQHNTYRTLTLDNPYVMPANMLRPTRTISAYIGLEGLLSSTTSFNVSGGLRSESDMVLYYRNPFYQYDSTFNALDVIYDNSQTFFARGELGINVNNNLQLGLSGELRSYNMEEQREAWHRAAFIAGLDVDYTIKEKIKLGADVNYIGKREAFFQDLNPEIESTLPAYLYANLELEYLYNTRLSAFVNVRNLTNSKYDMYLGYKAQSINFMMGFAYKL